MVARQGVPRPPLPRRSNSRRRLQPPLPLPLTPPPPPLPPADNTTTGPRGLVRLSRLSALFMLIDDGIPNTKLQSRLPPRESLQGGRPGQRAVTSYRRLHASKADLATLVKKCGGIN